MLRLILLATVTLLSGCSVLPSPPQEAAHLYQLQLNAPLGNVASTPPEERQGVVVVEYPQVAAGYDTTAMAYRRTPWEIRYYSLSRWVDEPARMLREALTSTLNQLGPFRAALDSPAGITVDYSLHTELLRLEQDFSGTPPSRQRLVVRVQLVDLARGALLASQVLELNTTAPSEDAHGGVAAANSALQQLAAEVVNLCRKALADPARARS
ncbi:MAG: membrane integrity-associated transporter subunit PqiC [Nitrococcus mobilis]|nr:membrane integrity-associated transporter subunit PqiC [Nitrococcus mobilis]